VKGERINHGGSVDNLYIKVGIYLSEGRGFLLA